ncbi:hypothetical protein FLL45_05320 [Aliikangiella marina]|uniref:TauD/TfdA-like domain-containing protein n=1 Tax=Aliikangiella marina TaxID=1712262 RepID=A0A545TJK9_9GAMM|nr:TauD/TfdA family dioxygenase [Aliikangiella marina]TQV77366.1 hypothetical protein FLL45_05320 [Aliikangiella marina]
MKKLSKKLIDGLVVLSAEPTREPSALFNWQKNNQQEFEKLLYEFGAVLFKGFNIDSTEKFNEYIESLPFNKLNYIDGNSPRTKLKQSVYTSTEFPAEYEISMHNELSYSNSWPDRLYFCCVTAPQSSGHTLIADSRKVLADLHPSIVEEFSSKGVLYTRYLHSGHGIGPSWKETFECEDQKAFEKACVDKKIHYEWHENGGVALKQTAAGVINHPVTKQPVWFNQADQFHVSNLPDQVSSTLEMLTNGDKSKYPTYAYFGDGSEIPLDMLNEIRRIFKKHTVYFEWQVGDLLLIDNVLTAHGRSPFKGERKVLVAMT